MPPVAPNAPMNHPHYAMQPPMPMYPGYPPKPMMQPMKPIDQKCEGYKQHHQP
jgi:hypothetical protein